MIFYYYLMLKFIYNEQKNQSVLKVENGRTMARGIPVKDGLSDPLMGPLERMNRCTTCNCLMNDCPGHFGRLELEKPVFHVKFLTTIMKVLNCVCCHCSKLLFDTVCFIIISLSSFFKYCLTGMYFNNFPPIDKPKNKKNFANKH